MPDDPISEAVNRMLARHMDKMLTEAFFGAGPVYSNAVPPGGERPPLTLEAMLAHAGEALGRIEQRDGDLAFSLIQDPWHFAPSPSFGGMQVMVKDAQEQQRTPRDVRGPWVRPGRVPSKLAGRKGTRRAWKRAHPPGWVWYYREPEDVLVLDGRTAMVTPRQWDALKRGTGNHTSGVR
jgi:hypothetical protein